MKPAAPVTTAFIECKPEVCRPRFASALSFSCVSAHIALRALASGFGDRRVRQAVPGGHANGRRRCARGRLRRGPDRQVPRVHRRWPAGSGAGQRHQSPRRATSWGGGGRAGREGRGRRGEVRDRIFNRWRAAVRPRDRRARLHGSGPASTSGRLGGCGPA